MIKLKKNYHLIAGQKAVKTKAKKAIAGFKIRAGMPLGVSVTLRNKIMYEFLDRLINIAIPRIRDFRGLNSNSFDGNGNYSFGIKEQIIFPEINYDKIDKVRGLNITICTSAKNNEDGLELLKILICLLWAKKQIRGEMAKLSSIQKNSNRLKLIEKFSNKRKSLKDKIMNKDLSIEDRLKIQNKLMIFQEIVHLFVIEIDVS